MANEQDLWQLIAAPITAFNEAEAVNGARFVELLEEYAFLPQETAAGDADRDSRAASEISPPRRFRELAFEVESRNAIGGLERREVRMPIFQFVPLGGLSIERAKLNFALALKAVLPTPGSSKASSARSAADAQDPGTLRRSTAQLPRITGTIARRAGSPGGSGEDTAVDGNVDVEIELKQMDLPAGVLELLQQTQGGVTTSQPSSATDCPGSDADTGGSDSGPWRSDQIFSLETLYTSEAALVPGKSFVAVVRLQLNGKLIQGRQVTFEAAPAPEGSLKLMAPGGRFVAEQNQELAFHVMASQRVAKYQPTTRVGIHITATIKGREESQCEFLELPR